MNEAIQRANEDGKLPLPEGGKHFDNGKAPLHFLESRSLLVTADVFGFGAKKYGDHNWRKGIKLTKLLDSVSRHVLALHDGQDFDEESGLSHVGHAIADLMMFYGTLLDKPELDDRYKRHAK